MTPWDTWLHRWQEAGLVDAAQADRIRAWERQRQQDRPAASGLRWPARLAVALGALMLAAGVLLFVAAHWDTLSPSARFAVVLATLGACHLSAAAAAGRFPAASTALHAVGSAALGGGIFLAGQIFQLQSHWPAGLLLWAAGVAAAWGLLRQWPQGAGMALLAPAWLAAEWADRTTGGRGAESVLALGLLLLAVAYIGAAGPGRAGPQRAALVWIGALALLPLSVLAAWTAAPWRADLPAPLLLAGTAAACAGPLAVAAGLRGSAAWVMGPALAWVLALQATRGAWPGRAGGHEIAMYALYALGAIGLVAWGLRDARRERVNLGVAAFALTVLAFYFSTVMDRLGRSASLVGLGLLFLAGGWALERTRRRLLARLPAGAQP